MRNRPGATSTMMPTPRTSREKTRDTFAGAVTTQNFKPAALQGFCQARCRTRTDNRLITSALFALQLPTFPVVTSSSVQFSQVRIAEFGTYFGTRRSQARLLRRRNAGISLDLHVLRSRVPESTALSGAPAQSPCERGSHQEASQRGLAGAGIRSCRQIARTVPNGISRCLGTGARRSTAEWFQITWLAPSRRISQP